MIPIALSTHWNAGRARSATDLVAQCHAAGFSLLELGYDLRPELVPELTNLVRAGTVGITSVHNFCPVPLGAPHGHPELFALCSPNRQERENAVFYTARSAELAASLGAGVLVAHAGCIDMAFMTPELLRLAMSDQIFSERYDKLKVKLMMQREKHAPRHRDAFRKSIEELLPRLQALGVTLAIEITPAWECYPCESELLQLLDELANPGIGYWHDIGHGQIRQNLGFISHQRWLERLQPHLVGMHVHDVQPPAGDHLMPPRGNIDFTSFKSAAHHARVRVLEPMPDTPEEDIRQGLAIVQQAWN